MSSPKQVAEGMCKKRIMLDGSSLSVSEINMCDWFGSKRKTRYRVCCRNCKYFDIIVGA